MLGSQAINTLPEQIAADDGKMATAIPGAAKHLIKAEAE